MNIFKKIALSYDSLYKSKSKHCILNPSCFYMLDDNNSQIRIGGLMNEFRLVMKYKKAKNFNKEILNSKESEFFYQFVAPELYNQKQVSDTEATDMWGIGSLLFYLIEGKPLFARPKEELAKSFSEFELDNENFEKKVKIKIQKLDSTIQGLLRLCFKLNPEERIKWSEFKKKIDDSSWGDSITRSKLLSSSKITVKSESGKSKKIGDEDEDDGTQLMGPARVFQKKLEPEQEPGYNSDEDTKQRYKPTNKLTTEPESTEDDDAQVKPKLKSDKTEFKTKLKNEDSTITKSKLINKQDDLDDRTTEEKKKSISTNNSQRTKNSSATTSKRTVDDDDDEGDATQLKSKKNIGSGKNQLPKIIESNREDN